MNVRPGTLLASSVLVAAVGTVVPGPVFVFDGWKKDRRRALSVDGREVGKRAE